ncbi:MAG: penicillin acylase family protein [Terracidiphilus sp.]|jgi:penicillin amidase
MANTESADRSQPRTAAPLPRSRKRRWPRILLLSAGGLLAVFLLAACVGVVWLRTEARAVLPVLDGDLHLTGVAGAGLSAPVTVRRDAHGVPHTEAATQDDLFVAQGYVTAQDRLWQMDAMRRNANGELAEIVGPSMVKHDRAQRVLQIRNTARRIYANLSPADRVRLDDYARGVNLFIAQHQATLPPEFKLLGYRPQPWSGVDSVSIGLTMVQMLDTHWETKLSREAVSAKLNNPKLEADLYPVGSWRDHPPTGVQANPSQTRPKPATATSDDDEGRSQASAAAPSVSLPRKSAYSLTRSPRGAGSNLPPLSKTTTRAPSFPLFSAERVGNHETQSQSAYEDLRALRTLLGLPACDSCAPGSNNWVIAGRHTASGKPLLSNDMHLGLTEPNIWYMADLKAAGFHAAGVTLPGMPCVIAGHNEHVAWGFTALYADVQDLYVEKLDGKGNYQALDGSWKPLQVDHEVIMVRGGKDVTLDVQLTAHGPLLNPIFTKETRPIALKWTLYDPALNSLPLYQLNVASNWAEFSAALAIWSWPTQNVAYSDDQGHIAYHAIGKVPIRGGGVGLIEVPLPHNTNDTRSVWGYSACAGICPIYIPFDQMPNAFDPPSGFLATANSRVTTEKSPYPLTLEWVDPYRAERIYKSLEGRDHLTPADLLAVQTDIYSEVDQELAHRFAYAIDHTPGVDDRLRKASGLLRAWDGRLTTGSAASIVTQTRYALWPLILEPKLGKQPEDYHWSESNFAEEEIIMHASPDWLPPGYKNWDALLTEAVRQGMKKGKAPGDVAEWSYGSWHVVDIEHPLAGFLPLIGRVAGTGPQPLSGDTTTVKQVGREFGPTQRFTMDWSNIDGSTENIVLGESGNPLSPYYRDQWNDYYAGTTFAFPFTPAAVAAQTRHTLRLLP